MPLTSGTRLGHYELISLESCVRIPGRSPTCCGTPICPGPSAGGSAFTQEVEIGDTPIRLRIGSMASFQADGRLFDGHGITTDVVVEPAPDYFIGGADRVLAEAIHRLGRSGVPVPERH